MHGAVLRPAIKRACSVGAAGGNQAIRKRHAPGKMCWLAVVAIAGDEAADAAHRVSHGCREAGNIQHGEHVHAVAPGNDQQRGNAGDEASKPGKATAEPAQQRAKALESFGIQAVSRSINGVPDLCTQDSRKRHQPRRWCKDQAALACGSPSGPVPLISPLKRVGQRWQRPPPSAGEGKFPAAQCLYKEAVGSPQRVKV